MNASHQAAGMPASGVTAAVRAGVELTAARRAAEIRITDGVALGPAVAGASARALVGSAAPCDPFRRPWSSRPPFRYAGYWSSAQARPRLAVVRALLRRPDVLLLDETTSQLDVTQ